MYIIDAYHDRLIILAVYIMYNLNCNFVIIVNSCHARALFFTPLYKLPLNFKHFLSQKHQYKTV